MKINSPFFFLLFLFFLPITAYAAMPSLNFTVNMSETVFVNTTGGTPTIALTVDDKPRVASYVTGTGTNALTFTYTPTVGDVDLDGITFTSPYNIILNSGTIKDTAGNAASLSFTPPVTTGVKVNYPSLSMDFVADADGRYTLNGNPHDTLSAFLTDAGGAFSRSSIGTYFDSTGILQTAAANTPRFDYDPVTHTAKGLLLEDVRTNILLQSTSITTLPWNYTSCGGITNTGATTTAPDGTTVPVYNFSNTSCLYQDIAITNGAAYTHSIWIKANKSGTIGFRNPGQGTVGFAATSINVNTSWQRFTVTATSSQNSTRFLVDNRTSNGYGVSGLELSFFGAQVEQGAFPTSYIPTTSSAITRQEDFLIIPTGSWYNQTAGSFYNNVSWISSSGTSYPMFFKVDDTTNNERWNLFYDQSADAIGMDAYALGVFQGSYYVSAVGRSGSIKVAAGQTTNNANMAYNGVLKTVDTSWSTPTVTRLNLRGSAAVKWFNSLKYYPLRASDTQLQLMTQ